MCIQHSGGIVEGTD